MEIVKVSPSAYQLTDRASSLNTGVVVTDDGVVLIDTGASSEMAERIQARVREITDRPIVYAINTHFHAQHTMGNRTFPVAVIGHRDCYERMCQMRQIREPDFHKVCGGRGVQEEIVPPTVRFDRDGYLYIGGLLIGLTHCPGHTDGSIVVHIPSERVLFASDNLCVEGCPVLDGGDPARWMESLVRMQCMGATTLVPGRGRLGRADDLQSMYLYFESLFSTAARLHRQGLSGEELASSDQMLRLTDCCELTVHRENIHQVIKSLENH
ncbi:MAG: MBL fold metallo-hydrolase [Candidatus Riflebacteria bacterium]|nr:MBL fold metallo-hydrolase [Candidatus Riflebacteria bacterium]